MLSTIPRFPVAGALCLLFAGGAAVARAADDWPQWRGPQRDGQARGASLPSPLPWALKKIWQVEVGEGHSSPVVAGDRVFVPTRSGEDEVVRALDLATGRELWRHADPTAYQMT